MKKIILVLFLILLPCIYATTNVYIGGGLDKARIDVVSYDPVPAMPGEYFDLYLKLVNLDEFDVSNLQLEIIENFPFSIEGEKIKKIATLKKNQQTFIHFKIRVAQDAVEGENDLVFKYTTPLGQWYSEALKINVKVKEAVLNIEKVESNPERIPPGGTADIGIFLKNSKGGDIKDVSLLLSIGNLPFAPIGSSTKKEVKLIPADKINEFRYKLFVEGNAEPKVYKMPVIIKYSTQSEIFTKEDTISLIVASKPEYQINIEESNVFVRGDIGGVVVSVSNVGPSEMKFTSLELLNSDDYDIIGNSRNYLGNLEPDDFETADYKINVKKSKSVPLKLLLNYKNSYNEEFKDEIELNLPIYSKYKAVKYGLKKTDKSILSIIFLLLFLFFIYRVYKNWMTEKDLELAVKKTAKSWFNYTKIKSKEILLKVKRKHKKR